jgi:hypothetical protein
MEPVSQAVICGLALVLGIESQDERALAHRAAIGNSVSRAWRSVLRQYQRIESMALGTATVPVYHRAITHMVAMTIHVARAHSVIVINQCTMATRSMCRRIKRYTTASSLDD